MKAHRQTKIRNKIIKISSSYHQSMDIFIRTIFITRSRKTLRLSRIDEIHK